MHVCMCPCVHVYVRCVCACACACACVCACVWGHHYVVRHRALQHRSPRVPGAGERGRRPDAVLCVCVAAWHMEKGRNHTHCLSFSYLCHSFGVITHQLFLSRPISVISPRATVQVSLDKGDIAVVVFVFFCHDYITICFLYHLAVCEIWQ